MSLTEVLRQLNAKMHFKCQEQSLSIVGSLLCPTAPTSKWVKAQTNNFTLEGIPTENKHVKIFNHTSYPRIADRKIPYIYYRKKIKNNDSAFTLSMRLSRGLCVHPFSTSGGTNWEAVLESHLAIPLKT